MCLICVEFQKQRMTTGEARRALGEMIDEMDGEHVQEVEEMLDEAEEEQRQRRESSTDDTGA